jgi:uncharacterized spore protein YtfJ
MSKKKDNNNESVDKLIDNTFAKLKDIIDANTIIGKTIKLGENVAIIPISKVSVGLVTGGGEMPVKRKILSSLGSTTGFTLIPIGFLTINDTIVNYISTSVTDSSTNKLIETFASIYDKFIKYNGESDENEN